MAVAVAAAAALTIKRVAKMGVEYAICHTYICSKHTFTQFIF